MSKHYMGEIVKIDGSYGEGGGQILRTSLALSIVTGKPLQIYNIRKGRKHPGLQPQHLTCILAARDISSADTEGDRLGSLSLQFIPHEPRSGKYHFNVAEKRGSAGSTTLVLHTILLPLAMARNESVVTVEGGTHVPWSPPLHYLSEIFALVVAKLGYSFSFGIDRWGWYPRGGGSIHARIFPKKGAHSDLLLESRGNLLEVSGLSAVSNLPSSIAERQWDEAIRLLHQKGLDAGISILEAPSIGPGTFLFIKAVFENGVAGFSALGRKGKRAEEVASEALSEFFEYLETGAVMDPHLADQILLYLAVSGTAHSFTTSRITQHLLTNAWVIGRFLPNVDITIDGEAERPGRVIIQRR
ncbi:MAG: RNA 3'-terminal phosphate cyclase [Acidobacteriota bacterium]